MTNLSSSTSLLTCLQNLDESQKSALRELRSYLANDLNPDDDDFLLLRFLKARSFDFEKAKKLLSEHLKFRKNIAVATGKDYTPNEVLDEYSSWAVLGNDKDGDPVTYSLMAVHDFKGILYSTPLSEQTKYCLYALSKHYGISTKSKNEATGTFIFDLDNISFGFATSQLVLRQHLAIIRMYLSNFPETLKACYVINVPSFFPILFNLYKHILDPGILQKIKIYGKDGYQEDFLKVMDADILPACLGGTRTDPDGNPECLTLFRRGFLKIPTSLYLDSKDMDSESGTYDICIKERASYDYRVRVDDANSTLKWYFRTVTYNIKFGVFYVSDKVPQTPKLNRKYAKSSNKTLQKVGYEPIVAVELVESHVIPERGEYTCENVGTYVFRFDNTFSWMTPKEVSFKVDVIAPSKEKTNLLNGHKK